MCHDRPLEYLTNRGRQDRCGCQVADETAGDGLAALVNNAGRAITAPLEHLPLPVLREQLEVNLIGVNNWKSLLYLKTIGR